MHEMAVTESIASICLKHAERHGARKVLQVNIRLGELTGIVDRYVVFYWDVVTKDTIAEGAKLNFTKVPVRARCQRCGDEYPVGEELDLTCPHCGELDSEIVSGKEFTVESIEIE